MKQPPNKYVSNQVQLIQNPREYSITQLISKYKQLKFMLPLNHRSHYHEYLQIKSKTSLQNFTLKSNQFISHRKYKLIEIQKFSFPSLFLLILTNHFVKDY